MRKYTQRFLIVFTEKSWGIAPCTRNRDTHIQRWKCKTRSLSDTEHALARSFPWVRSCLSGIHPAEQTKLVFLLKQAPIHTSSVLTYRKVLPLCRIIRCFSSKELKNSQRPPSPNKVVIAQAGPSHVNTILALNTQPPVLAGQHEDDSSTAEAWCDSRSPELPAF